VLTRPPPIKDILHTPSPSLKKKETLSPDPNFIKPIELSAYYLGKRNEGSPANFRPSQFSSKRK